MTKQRDMKCDVVVVGGGSAGVAAAIGAAQTGADTILIEKNPYFGGAATHSSVLTYCGFFTQGNPPEQIVGGVGQKVLNNLSKIGMYDGPKRTPHTGTVIVLLDPEATKIALDNCIAENNVKPLLHVQVIGTNVEDGKIKAIECVDHSGRFTIEAEAFIDASGEANLTALAGGEYICGNEKGTFQAGTLMIRIGGVREESNAHPLEVQKAIKLGKEHGIAALTKELGTIVRMPGSKDVLAILADEGVNGLDSVSMTKAEMSARKQAWGYLEAFKKYLPGFENAYLVQTGPQIGIRETRHIVGDYILTHSDVLNARRHNDSIGRGGWPMESHSEPGAPNVWQSIANNSYYDIPLRSLKVRNINNLWAAGRTIACDPDAFASVRVMGTAFATGHAAGVTAALYCQHGFVDPVSVRNELLIQDAII
ncbi:FAD-dependent oxidoreductase [Fictibacillus arsenicus]|uniref:FAD-dependent oxidoreductase n=1 Tax=Fictibacillus arsenicus TaxID=255247 RepID=A0A1B1Z927_9BACL|nr:FAD-dependent oxidoreductase [Fictibacillus arsenicus]ANX13935.1 FAD-dependent oxidoreductase [Fictibacillus arsenicus]